MLQARVCPSRRQFELRFSPHIQCTYPFSHKGEACYFHIRALRHIDFVLVSNLNVLSHWLMQMLLALDSIMTIPF